MCGNEKVPRWASSGAVQILSFKVIYKRNRVIEIERRFSSSFSSSFFFLFYYVIKGIPEERSRGSKVQKNCAFIREDDARPILP